VVKRDPEVVGRGDVFYAQHVHAMPWDANACVQEVLAGLAEKSFIGLNFGLKEGVPAYARCPKSAVVLVNLGNRARASECAHSASKLGRTARYQQALHCGVCEDHDLRPVSVLSIDAAGAPKITPKTFLPSNSTFSLGESYPSQRRRYMNPTPSRWRMLRSNADMRVIN
jgi:hypothetical protein